MLGSYIPNLHSIGWTVVLTDEGANGAANSNGSVDSGQTWLGDLGEVFGIDTIKYKMSVVTGGDEPCDLNSDGSCNVDDLSGEPRGSFFHTDLEKGSKRRSVVQQHDFNSDGIVNTGDLDFWLEDAADLNEFDSAFLRGDANLNGIVDFDDFLVLSSHFGTDNRDWSAGNFNGDNAVDFTDFLALSANYGNQLSKIAGAANPAAAAVPEPRGIGLAMFAIFCILGFRKRK